MATISIKKLVKYSIPYGFLVLRNRIQRKKKEGVPIFKNIKFHAIENGIQKKWIGDVTLCNTTIKRTIDENNLLEICREDYEYPIYLRNNTTDVWLYREILEKREYNFFAKEEPKYIIDAGANIGLTSIYFANKYKDAKIIAIEPEEENYKLLKINTKKYPNVITMKAALWNTSGEISLFDVGFGDYSFMVETNASALKPSTKNIKCLTKTVTVDEIMRDFNIDSVDILKIDIEGSEKEVLESCENWIDKTKCIIVELHEHMKKGCNKAFYKIINQFDQIGQNGEDMYLLRDNYIKMI